MTGANVPPAPAHDDQLRVLLDRAKAAVDSGDVVLVPVDLLSELVAAAQLAGNTAAVFVAEPDLTDDDVAELKRRFQTTAHLPAVILPGPTPDQLDQAEAAGYAAAVARLRDTAQRTGSPAARWAADYLEAVGPATGTAGAMTLAQVMDGARERP